MHNLLKSDRTASAILCALVCANTLPVFAADTAPTATQPAADKTPVTVAQEQNAAAADKEDPNAPKVMWKPGQALETTTDTEDIVATYDTDLAKRQVTAYPDSPEASFILAVALTRTSRVEEALKEVQRARKLAESKGGVGYFDKMIASYEKMLVGYPDDNQVRYGLAWAYYMKAYLLAQFSRNVAKWRALKPEMAPQLELMRQQAGLPASTTSGASAPATANGATPPATTASAGAKQEVVRALKAGDSTSALAALASVAAQGGGDLKNLPKIPSALERVEPTDIPQIKALYDKALQKIDEILQREPSDVWTIIYGAHLRAEYTGNLEQSMQIWRAMAAKYPTNPGPFFFLGEGYLKQGNLKESINNVGKAIALRALGN
jgi:tetratricopeptide (TPR) repeat protein